MHSMSPLQIFSSSSIFFFIVAIIIDCPHIGKFVTSHVMISHRANSLSCLFFTKNFGFFHPYKLVEKNRKITRRIFSVPHAVILVCPLSTRWNGEPSDEWHLPRSHNPWRPSSSQRIAGRSTGVINCYSRVLDPSDSSVLRSSVLVARGDLFFELPHSIRSSPFFSREEPPSFTRPTPTQETLRPLLALFSYRFSFCFTKVST